LRAILPGRTKSPSSEVLAVVRVFYVNTLLSLSSAHETMEPPVREGSGGLSVSEEMLSIIQQPGYISMEKRGQKFRELYQDGDFFTLSLINAASIVGSTASTSFNANLLFYFAKSCYLGILDNVARVIMHLFRTESLPIDVWQNVAGRNWDRPRSHWHGNPIQVWLHHSCRCWFPASGVFRTWRRPVPRIAQIPCI
jgi:hypothetical protein